MIESILFDLDGTLADTAPDLAGALNAVRLSRNLPELPNKVIRPAVSLGAGAMIKVGFDIEEGHSDFEEIRENFLRIYSENIANKTKLFDGIEVVLSELENTKKTWGIVTNKSSALTIPLLKALSLDKRAACIVCGDTLEHTKPHPAPIIHACQQIQSDPALTVFVGDAKRDIEAGNKAGTKTVVALYGYINENDDPKKWGADGTITSPHEIHEILEELSK